MVSCATGPKVKYGDARAVETITPDYGSTDLQLISQKMVESLLQSDILGPNKPIIALQRIKNFTSEHIDTEAITNKIRTAILKSGKARFSATDYKDDILDQLEFQNNGLVNPETAAKYGKIIGAQYVLTGRITSIVKQEGRIKDIYYNVNFVLINVETGLIEWSDEKEIRKGSQRRLIGW